MTPPLSTPSPEEALLPCPFCGGAATISRDVGKVFYVACDACGVSKAIEATKALAIAAWNRRAALSACPSGTEVAQREEDAFARWYEYFGKPLKERAEAAEAKLRQERERAIEECAQLAVGSRMGDKIAARIRRLARGEGGK